VLKDLVVNLQKVHRKLLLEWLLELLSQKVEGVVDILFGKRKQKSLLKTEAMRSIRDH
jgi:hypothetical protein